MGASVPLYTIDKSYNLYPGDSVTADSLAFDLVPGNYLLKYRTTKTAEVEVPVTIQPAGIGTVSLIDPTGKIPLGRSDIEYTVSNSDTVAGNIEVVVELKKGTIHKFIVL